MITTRASSKRNGFTLVEVMVATTLLSFMLAGLVGTFVFMLRSSVSLGNYADMNRDGSYFLERFGREIRMTKNVSAISSSSFIIDVDLAGTDDTVEYVYDASNGSLIRISNLEGKSVLLDNISSLSIDYYNILGVKTNNLNEVKSIQLRVDLSRKNIKNDNTDHIISARFNMRNRIITN